MKHFCLIASVLFLSVMVISGCSDSPCNTCLGSGSVPAPVPVPVPTPTPTPRAISYSGVYDLAGFWGAYSSLRVSEPMSKGSPEELFGCAYNAEPDRFASPYQMFNIGLSNSQMNTVLPLGAPLFPSPLEYGAIEYPVFALIPGESAFYTNVLNRPFSPPALGINYNYFPLPLTMAPFYEMNNGFDVINSMFFSKNSSELYCLNYDLIAQQYKLIIFSKRGSLGAVSHELISETDLSVLIPEVSGATFQAILFDSVIADTDGNVYIGYHYNTYKVAPAPPPTNWEQQFEFYYKIAKLVKSEDGYTVAGDWDYHYAFKSDYAGFYSQCRMELSWGPEGKIICATAAIPNVVNIIEPSTGAVIGELPPPASRNEENIYPLSASYNEATGNIYVLGLYGQVNEEPMTPQLFFPTMGVVYVYSYK